MKRASKPLRYRWAIAAVVLCANALTRGDDPLTPTGNPLPLFTPADSVRLMPLESRPGGSSTIESKDDLYDRLRQSLLDLERRLAEREESPAVPDPPVLEDPLIGIESGTNVDPGTEVVDPALPLIPEDPVIPEDSSVPPIGVDTSEEVSPGQSPTENTTSGDTEQGPRPLELPLSEATISQPNIPALADNLFALGEYDLAHASYTQLNMESLSAEDQIWVTYQLAGCLRHLHQPEAAAALYRQVMSQHPEHHLAGISRWWLDAMEEDAEQRQEAESFRQTLKRLQELRDASAP